MARRKKKRRSNKDKLKEEIYFRSVQYTLTVADGHPDARLRDDMFAACDAAFAAGLRKPSVEAQVRRGAQDAEKIMEFVEEFPDAVVKLTRSGWKVEGAGKAN